MRKNQATKRISIPDPIYNSTNVTKLINMIMWDGKRSLAQNIVYKSLDYVQKKLDKPAIEIFDIAINNVMPILELKVRRVAGANYQIPVEVNTERRITLALRWIVLYSRSRNEKSMILRLASEIIDAFNNTGLSIKKKDDTHKMAEANKAFAHLRF